MKKTLTVLGGVAALTAVTACAPEDPYHHNRTQYQRDNNSYAYNDYYYLNAADANNDGVISRAEYNQFTKQMFLETDINRDNALTFAEIDAKVAYNTNPAAGPYGRDYRYGDRYVRNDYYYLNAADTNDDGIVSRLEYKRFTTQAFLEADDNRDNVLTTAELGVRPAYRPYPMASDPQDHGVGGYQRPVTSYRMGGPKYY